MTERFDAINHTDFARMQAEGLAEALYELSTEHPALGNQHRLSLALIAVVVALKESIADFGKRLDDERDLETEKMNDRSPTT